MKRAKKANDWSISDVKSSLNGDGFLNKEGVFTTAEKNAIAASNVNSHALTTDSETGVNVAIWTQSNVVNYVALTGEQIFLLDAEDVSNGAYGYSMTDESTENRKKTGSSGAYFWWLRSALNDYDDRAGYVTGDGGITDNHVSNMYTGVSPALNLNLSSVLFSSVISGTAGETGAEYKLTLKDTEKSVKLTEGRIVTKASDGTITVPYTYTDKENATETEKVNQISVMITDKAYDAEKAANAQEAQILYYGALQDIKNAEGTSSTVAEASTGTGTFALPSGLTGTLGTDYHIYLLAEHVNADNSTDYASEPVKVEKIYLDISEATAVQNGTLTYDGTAQTPTFTVTHGNTTLTADDYDVTVTAQTNAGSYTATITGKGNCLGTIADVAWEILPANIDDTSMTYAPLTYNGAEQTPVFTIKLGNTTLTADDYDVTVTAQTNAGNYTATITGKGNYRGTISSVTWSIGKATPSVTAPTAKTGLVYKGTAQELISAGSTDFGTIVYSLAVDGEYSTTIPTGTNAGNYTVYYKVQGNDSVSDIAAEPITATIGKAAVTVTAKSYTIKVGEALPTYAYDVAGLVNGETLPIDVTISCNAADSNTAETYTITVSGAANSTNYTFAYVNGTLTISNKLEQTITASDITLTYGETGKKITATTSGNGAISYSTTSDVISVAADGTITALKAGTATVTINAAETDTYAATTKTVTVTVNKAAVTVTAKSYTIKVGEALPTYAYDVAGLVNGETLPIDVTISCNAADSNTAGTYDIILSGAAASDNYTFSYVKGTLTVSEKEVVAAPTFTPASGTTFTSSQKVTISCATAGAKIYYTTDGTEPTTASTLYNGAFTITTTTTIKAIAVKDGMTDSTVVTATYTKKSSGGGGGRGGYRPTTPTTTNPSISGSAKSWSDVAADLGKLTNGTEVTIQLNGNTTVPVEVIKAIDDRQLKVTFVVDSVKSWKTDGAEITAPAAADLSIIATSKLKTDVLRGISGYQFSTNNTNITTDLEIAFKTSHAGKFANLYKSVDGKLAFVTCAKLGEDGKVILPDVVDKGEYVVMLCEFSDRLGDMDNDGIMNAKDAAAILKDIVEIEPGKNPLMADFNGDGKVNAMDASAILKRIVGLA